MTTLPDRPNSALLVIDVQNGVMATATDRDGVVRRIGNLVEKARSAGTPVVWVQHNSEELLLVVAGAQSDACIRSTIHGAFTRGYDVTLVGDAHTTEDLTQWGAPPPEQVISHLNLCWTWQDGPGREAEVVEAAAVSF